MVDLTHISGLDDHGDLGARVPAQQMVLHRGGEQQRRDRPPRVVGVAIGEHEEVGSVFDGFVDFLEDLVETFLQSLTAACDLVEALDDERLVVAAEDLGSIKALELRHFVGVEHR